MHMSEDSVMCAGTNNSAYTERGVFGGGFGCAVTAESSAPEIFWKAERRFWGTCTEPCKTLTPEAIGFTIWRSQSHHSWANHMVREL